MNEYAKSDESHLLRSGSQHPAYRVCGHRGMGRTAKPPAGRFAVWRVSRGSPRPVRCYLWRGYTRFLLEYAAFLMLTDMGKDLPEYEEIPVPLKMPKAVREEYEKIERVM